MTCALRELNLARAAKIGKASAEQHQLMLEGCELLRRGAAVLDRVPAASVQKMYAQHHLEFAAEAMKTCQQGS